MSVEMLSHLYVPMFQPIAGMNARRPEGSKEADFDAPPTQFHAIMQKLFPVLLSLACAAEPVSRQLFEPLVMSLVHWLTRSARRLGLPHGQSFSSSSALGRVSSVALLNVVCTLQLTSEDGLTV